MVQWSNENTGSSIYHKVELQSPQQNVEIANQAQDGTTYYAMSTVSNVSRSRCARHPYCLLNVGAVSIWNLMAN